MSNLKEDENLKIVKNKIFKYKGQARVVNAVYKIQAELNRLKKSKS